MGVNRKVGLRIAPPGYSPGAQGWLRPAILLPEGLSVDLTPVELDAVLTHEMAHIRRWDNWTSAAAVIVRNIFWFHPLLWWMERRLVLERETACDELVLLHGVGAPEYVKAIAKVCRGIWMEAAAGTSIADSNLKRRMEHIMTTHPKAQSSRFLKATLGTLAALAVLTPASNGFLKAQPQTAPNSSADAMFSVCLADTKSGNWRQAEQCLRKLNEIEPDSLRVVLGLGYVLIGQEQFDQAIDYVRSHVGGTGKSASYEAQIYIAIGEANRRKRALPEAMFAFRRAAELEPEQAFARLQLALLLEGTGRREEARVQYEGVLKIEPDHPIALNNLAYIMSDSGNGDLTVAAAYANRAAQMAPTSADIRDTVGWVAYKRQRIDEAIASFKEAVTKDPRNMDFRNHLVAALDQKGLDSPADRVTKSALQNSATDPDRVLEMVKSLGN